MSDKKLEKPLGEQMEQEEPEFQVGDIVKHVTEGMGIVRGTSPWGNVMIELFPSGFTLFGHLKQLLFIYRPMKW